MPKLKKDIIDYFELVLRSVNLPERDKEFVYKRIFEKELLTDIAEECGISRERLRQIVEKGIKKINHKMMKSLDVGNPELDERFRSYFNKFESELPVSPEIFYKAIYSDFEDVLKNRYLIVLLEKLAIRAGIVTDKCDNLDAIITNIKQNLKSHRAEVYKKERQETKQIQKMDDILNKVRYYGTTTKLDLRKYGLSGIVRKRGEGESKIMYKGAEIRKGFYYSKKMNKEIYYDSGIELLFYELLEKSDRVKYYFDQPFKINYTYNGRERDYYPDTLVVLKNKKMFVVEIKPITEMGLFKNRLKWREMKSFCNETGIGYIITDLKKSLIEIKKEPIDARFENDMLILLKKTDVDYVKYQYLASKYKIKYSALTTLIYKHDLIFEERPFLLRKIEIQDNKNSNIEEGEEV